VIRLRPPPGHRCDRLAEARARGSKFLLSALLPVNSPGFGFARDLRPTPPCFASAENEGDR